MAEAFPDRWCAVNFVNVPFLEMLVFFFVSTRVRTREKGASVQEKRCVSRSLEG